MNRFSKHFRSSFHRIRDPLLIVDSDGLIRAANPAARDVLDFDEGEIFEMHGGSIDGSISTAPRFSV